MTYTTNYRNSDFIITYVLTSLFILLLPLRPYLLFFLWFFIAYKAFRNLSEMVTLFAFLVSFFTFLLGRVVIPLFVSQKPDYHENISNFSQDQWNFIYLSLYLSLLFVYIGYCSGRRGELKAYRRRKRQNKNYVERVKVISKYLIYISICFKLLTTLEIIKHVFTYGYLALYLEPPQELPYVVYKLSDLFTLAVYLFLASMPSKKESRFIITCYVLVSLFSLFTGRRGFFMFAILLLFVYFYIRNKINPEQEWITARMKRMCVIILPFLLIGMYLIGFIRMEATIDDTGDTNPLLSFFYSQGGSVQMIGLVKESIESLPKEQHYLFGPLLHMFDGTTIGSLFGLDALVPQTTDMALKGDSLGDYLTYKYDPNRYLSGGGYGSCFIAEAYADLRIPGIISISFLFGWLLSRFRFWLLTNIWFSAMSFYILFGILRSPRGSTFGFLKECLTPTNLILILLIHISAVMYSKSKAKESNEVIVRY